VKGLRVSVVAVIAATGAISGVAHAAQPNRLHEGVFSFTTAPAFNPTLTFDIVRWRGWHEVSKGGRQVVSWAKVSCTSGSAPPAGIPANHSMLLRIPGNLAILGHRSFGYSGPATVYPIGDSNATVSTELVLQARFVGVARTRTATYPTGFEGLITSSACASGSPVAFSFDHL
jgi:hypothetical protein